MLAQQEGCLAERILCETKYGRVELGQDAQRCGSGDAGTRMVHGLRQLIPNTQSTPRSKERQVPLDLPWGHLTVVLPPLGFFQFDELLVDDPQGILY